MNLNFGTGLIILVFLVYLTGTCLAENTTGYLATFAGGESTIVNDTQDMILITVHNPDSKVNITKEDNTTQISIEKMQYAILPIDGVFVFAGPEKITTSLVKIENLSVSNDTENLTLQVKPLDFYDGKVLSSYAKNTVKIQELDGKIFNGTELYLEMIKNIPENWDKPKNSCDRCKIECHGDRPCELQCEVLCLE